MKLNTYWWGCVFVSESTSEAKMLTILAKNTIIEKMYEDATIVSKQVDDNVVLTIER